jgi:hypothetical protein
VQQEQAPALVLQLLLPESTRQLSQQVVGNAAVHRPAAMVAAEVQVVAAAEVVVLKRLVCRPSDRQDAETFWLRGTRLHRKRSGEDWPPDLIRAAACQQQEIWSSRASTIGFLLIAQTPENSFWICRQVCRKQGRP